MKDEGDFVVRSERACSVHRGYPVVGEQCAVVGKWYDGSFCGTLLMTDRRPSWPKGLCQGAIYLAR